MIAQNIQKLRNSIEEICKQCNRKPEDLTVVAVSKTWPQQYIREAFNSGITDVGENYVQELLAKQKELSDLPLRWHFIGHLQSNKVKYIIDTVCLIHSVDDIGVGKEINKRAAKIGKVQDVLIEVHTTKEQTKFGVRPEHTKELIKQLATLPNLRVCGLMTMGPFSEDPEDSRPSFRLLRNLRDEILREGIDTISMQHLSMGMTHDYTIAIEEGATILRIGTAIFGERKNY